MMRVSTFGQRRVAVPVVELVLAEPLGLHRVVAVREPRIGGAHRRDQRVDHLALDAVRQMARVGHVLEAAPAVGDLLVLGERVGDQREQAEILLAAPRRARRSRRGGVTRRGPAARFSVGSSGSSLPSTLKRRPAMVSSNSRFQAPATGDRLFVKQLLDAVLELIGLLLAHVLDPGPVVAEAPARRAPSRSAHRRCG